MPLRIEGHVATPATLDFADIAALDGQIADVSVLAPGRVGGAVRVSSLLARVGAGAGAAQLTVTSRDGGFHAEVPLAVAASALLVYCLGDGPLPAEHGGPLRFLIPDATACGLEGVDACANVKDVGRLRVA